MALSPVRPKNYFPFRFEIIREKKKMIKQALEPVFKLI